MNSIFLHEPDDNSNLILEIQSSSLVPYIQKQITEYTLQVDRYAEALRLADENLTNSYYRRYLSDTPTGGHYSVGAPYAPTVNNEALAMRDQARKNLDLAYNILMRYREFLRFLRSRGGTIQINARAIAFAREDMVESPVEGA